MAWKFTLCHISAQSLACQPRPAGFVGCGVSCTPGGLDQPLPAPSCSHVSPCRCWWEVPALGPCLHGTQHKAALPPLQTSLCLFTSLLSLLALWPEIFTQVHTQGRHHPGTYLKRWASFSVELVCDCGPGLEASRRAFGKDALKN